jgi:hypothetical protein
MATKTPQSGDGYKCSCGYITDDKTKFLIHIGAEGRKAKKEGVPNEHKSEGRVNISTGELTMPPYMNRTPEQKAESNFGRKEKKLTADGKIINVRTTDILGQASEIRFVPRIYTTTYTPIMMQAQDAAVKWFGWRPNMPFENFLDTVLFMFFKEHGIELGQYTVDDSLVAARNNGDGEQEPENSTPADIAE